MSILRKRLLRALQIGAITAGDRLPGTRELAREFAADPRVVAEAYRDLATEGLVELRPRAGVFVHPSVRGGRARPHASAAWLAEVFTSALERGIPARDLPGLLRRALGKTPIPIAVLATTLDQTMGICHELDQLIGASPTGVLIETLPLLRRGATVAEARAGLPRAVLRARLLVTTEAHATRIDVLAAAMHRPCIAVSVRRELYETEWQLLQGCEAYVIVADPRFGYLVSEYLRSKRQQAPIHVLVAGRDDIRNIPEDAPVYATHAARKLIGATRLPRGLLPAARTLSEDCLQAILRKTIELSHEDPQQW